MAIQRSYNRQCGGRKRTQVRETPSLDDGRGPANTESHLKLESIQELAEEELKIDDIQTKRRKSLKVVKQESLEPMRENFVRETPPIEEEKFQVERGLQFRPQTLQQYQDMELVSEDIDMDFIQQQRTMKSRTQTLPSRIEAFDASPKVEIAEDFLMALD